MRIEDQDGNPVVDTRVGYMGPEYKKASYDTQEIPAIETGSIIFGAIVHVLRVLFVQLPVAAVKSLNLRGDESALKELYRKESWLEVTVLALSLIGAVALVLLAVVAL